MQKTTLVGLLLVLWALPAGAGEAGEREPLIQAGAASFDLGVEYRLRNIYINPLELNGTDAVEVGYGIQRLRTAWEFDWDDKVKIVTQMDFLDGVLVGDNGLIFGEDPYPNEGTATLARWPNEAGIAAVLKEGMDPYDPDSYTYGLKRIEPVKIRRAWGEVSIGVGVLKVGRMPAHEGRGLLGNDGDNDLNRFGPAGRGNSYDRILFGTKPLEVAKAIISGDSSSADSRQDRGLFLGFAYDRLVDDSIQLSADDAGQFGTSLIYKLPEFELLGLSGRNLKLAVSFAYRNSDAVELDLYVVPLELEIGIEDFHLEAQAAVVMGQTREVSDALALMSSRTPVAQDVLCWGMLAIADYHLGPVTLTMEFDFASGDDDPRPDTSVTDFFFAEDTKVGLLLFPQVLAYETARSSAAGNAILTGLGATNLPSTRMASGGAVTNAMVLFPQVTWNITEDIFVRAGALFAWAHKPVMDPHETLRNEDGHEYLDDAVNYNGGKPGDYWGTEFDLRFSVRLWEKFYFDLEGAFLLPGDALEDEHGDAVPSAMVEGRFTFRY